MPDDTVTEGNTITESITWTEREARLVLAAREAIVPPLQSQIDGAAAMCVVTALALEHVQSSDERMARRAARAAGRWWKKRMLLIALINLAASVIFWWAVFLIMNH